jgi:hypothetical protein
VAKTLFEAIGYALGQKAAQAKNAFDLVGGTEEDSLRAEIRLGRDLAAALLPGRGRDCSRRPPQTRA